MLAANGEMLASLNLSVTDIGRRAEDTAKAQFDGDGSLLNKMHGTVSEYNPLRDMYTFSFDLGSLNPSGCRRDNYEKNLSSPLKENELLVVLGTLLQIKYEHRNRLIEKLKSLGIKIPTRK